MQHAILNQILFPYNFTGTFGKTWIEAEDWILAMYCYGINVNDCMAVS